MALTIRTATIADLDAVVPLFESYRQFFAGASEPAESRAFLAERLERNESVVLAAFDDAHGCVGFLQLYPLFSSWYCKRQWFLSDLYVVESHRNLGIGRKLVDACIGYAKRSGSRSILVEIPFSEPHLVTFYTGLDFIKDDVFELYRCKLV
jgi:ribosomal protein S18 acetylase RimI-like enzyme